MLKKWSSCCLLIGVSFATTGASAATPINLKDKPSAYLHSFLNTTSEFKKISSIKDFNQTTHTRYQQTYAGHPVWGADFIVHTPQGVTSLQSMNGIIYEDLQKDIGNTSNLIFNSHQAEKAQQQAIDLYLKNGKVKGTIEQTNTKLIVFVDNKNKAHWSFLISFYMKPFQGTPAKPIYILDAQTFEVYRNWNDIKTLDHVDGGGNGGNLKTGMHTYDGRNRHFPKLDMMRDSATNVCFLQNDEVTVTNASKHDAVIQFKCKSVDNSHNSVYWDGMADWANFGFSPGNDALYAGKVIKSMYSEWYKLPVLVEDGKPMMLKMRVHDRSFQGIENAYWDGHAMTFGDGLFMFYPLVSLGVGAHEVSHGFTEQHSNLVYDAQSGGLNESFSDMAAQAAEFYSTGKNTWQIGSDVTKFPGQALRYMDEPTKDCQGRQPGNMCSINNASQYNDKIDVHFSSGVFNKAYYLIGTSAGWDARKAFDVMVQANMNYWTSNTTFNDAACGVVKATRDYKYDVEAVKKAFAGVGVSTQGC